MGEGDSQTLTLVYRETRCSRTQVKPEVSMPGSALHEPQPLGSGTRQEQWRRQVLKDGDNV